MPIRVNADDVTLSCCNVCSASGLAYVQGYNVHWVAYSLQNFHRGMLARALSTCCSSTTTTSEAQPHNRCTPLYFWDASGIWDPSCMHRRTSCAASTRVHRVVTTHACRKCALGKGQSIETARALQGDAEVGGLDAGERCGTASGELGTPQRRAAHRTPQRHQHHRRVPRRPSRAPARQLPQRPQFLRPARPSPPPHPPSPSQHHLTDMRPVHRPTCRSL